MKTLALYAVAAMLYVVGGAMMKYSLGLTRWQPTLALIGAISIGALIQAWAMRHEDLGASYTVVLGLEAALALAAALYFFDERLTFKAATGIV
ncbi:MAG: hypothetical protein FJ145_14175 [Deltaproteobacteria bacterium]|nr:hypothetical protein [Deltaproteobacteria bacterium]